jgi:hypothetical protein
MYVRAATPAQEGAELDIPTFAREQWRRHERDASAAAEAYLKAALESRDPYSALLHAVSSTMSDEFRSLRRAAEKQAPPWDAPGYTAGRHIFPAGETAWEHRLTLTDQRAQLLQEQVWTATRGWIQWTDITCEDIERTIAKYRQVANGIDLKIDRLDSARRVMERHGVERLGDAPWEEITGLVRGGSRTVTAASASTDHPGSTAARPVLKR